MSLSVRHEKLKAGSYAFFGKLTITPIDHKSGADRFLQFVRCTNRGFTGIVKKGRSNHTFRRVKRIFAADITYSNWDSVNRRTHPANWRRSMLFIPPCARHLRSVKTELSLNLPHVGSSHLSEAIAFACGYKTNAALRTQLWEPDTPPSEAATLTFNATAFESRLAVMGYELGPYFSGLEAFASKCWVSDTYRNARELAGRNLIVAAVLSGLTQNLFTLDAGDNRWPGASSRKPFKFHVWLPGSIPVTASVEDIGMGELSLSVSVKPTKGFIDGFAKGLGCMPR